MHIHHYTDDTAAHAAAVVDANAGHHVATLVLEPGNAYNLVDPERAHLPFLVGFIEQEQLESVTLRSVEHGTLIETPLDTIDLFHWVRALAGRTKTDNVYVYERPHDQSIANIEISILAQVRFCTLFGDIFLIATHDTTFHVCLDETYFKPTLLHQARQPEGTVRAERFRYVDGQLTCTDISVRDAHRIVRNVDRLLEP